jgi:diguanylate cyclase (GGDEF)-like protein
MISLKRYLDMEDPCPLCSEPDPNELFAASLESYNSLLCVIGKNATQISPALSADLEQNLRLLGQRAAFTPSPASLREVAGRAEAHLNEWGARAAEHFKAKTIEVKELLIALARTAESVGSRDTTYTSQFKELTGRLEKIADLDDLTMIRSSLVRRVGELKQSVDQMTRESQQLVAQLRADVSVYETRLKSVEHLILKDELTGMANRRSVEERINFNIENNETFCVVMLDLNGFKRVNDQHGHMAGDELLKQFAAELRLNTRSGDLVGRWGGDEFVVVLSCDVQPAHCHIERIRQWVFGKYTIPIGNGSKPIVLRMDASVGVAQWQSGESLQELLTKADAAMYEDKKRSQLARG